MKHLPALLILILTGAASAQIGLFESQGDVGANPKAGSAAYDAPSGEYRVTGGGENMWEDVDAFRFLWKRVSGDAVISADVRFLGESQAEHRKGVLIFRQSLDANSAYADVALHGDGLTALQYRPTAGAQTAEVRSIFNAPLHLRLERRGNVFTMTVSKEGAEPVTSAPVTLTLADPVYLGIGTCSHNANVLETAVFSNVRIQQARPPTRRYRSRISIFDTRDKSTRVLYTADEIWEAPNWTPDGKFLLSNSGGSLYRLAVDGPVPAVPDQARDCRLPLEQRSRPHPQRQAAGFLGHLGLGPAVAGVRGGRGWQGPAAADPRPQCQLLSWLVARRQIPGVRGPAQREV